MMELQSKLFAQLLGGRLALLGFRCRLSTRLRYDDSTKLECREPGGMLALDEGVGRVG